ETLARFRGLGGEAHIRRALDRVVTGTPPSTLIDARVLLAACDRNQGILTSISAALQVSLPERLSAGERALEQRDAPLVREMAHRLNGLVSPSSTVAAAHASEVEDCAT